MAQQAAPAHDRQFQRAGEALRWGPKPPCWPRACWGRRLWRTQAAEGLASPQLHCCWSCMSHQIRHNAASLILMAI